MKELNGQLLFVNGISPYLRKENKGGYMEVYSFNPNANKVNFYLPNPYKFDESAKGMTSFFAQRKMEQLEVFGKSAYFYSAYCDTLYQITKDTLHPFMQVDLGKHKFDYKNLRLPKAGFSQKVKKAIGDKITPVDILVTRKHVLFHFSLNKAESDFQSFIALYNIDKDEVTYYHPQILNDFTDGPNFFIANLRTPTILNIDIQYLKEPDESTKKMFFDGKDENVVLKFPERKDEFRNLMNRSKEDDNPIVVIIKLRDDF